MLAFGMVHPIWYVPRTCQDAVQTHGSHARTDFQSVSLQFVRARATKTGSNDSTRIRTPTQTPTTATPQRKITTEKYVPPPSLSRFFSNTFSPTKTYYGATSNHQNRERHFWGEAYRRRLFHDVARAHARSVLGPDWSQREQARRQYDQKRNRKTKQTKRERQTGKQASGQAGMRDRK